MIRYFIVLFLFTSLFSIDNGYFIYKFKIDKNDDISLLSSKYIDARLKISKHKKHTHDTFIYKLKNIDNIILFEGEITNPKIIHSEYLLNQKPSKNKVFLDEGYFVIKIPIFDNIDRIDFYKSNTGNHITEKIAEVKFNTRIDYMIDNHGRPDCPDGYVEDCSGDGDCCSESWIGDHYEDCEDQAYGCDLTCYDNDGGDCDNEDYYDLQIFPVTDIMVNGEDDSRVNIVFLGDGYTQNEMSDYISDVEDVTSALFETTPYSNYINYFNVYAINVPSYESGTDHPGTAPDCGGYNDNIFYADTYFDSSFDLYDIHRLLYIQNTSAAINVLVDNTPQWDIVFVMVNSTMYGGAGGTFAVFSRHDTSTEIAIHEIGHSFAGLSDEYWAGFNYAHENVNMTQNTDPLSIIWGPWLYDNGIGIYAHDSPGNEWYKPHQNCKMQFLGPPFCSVCIEQTIKSIYGILSPIDSYYPQNLEVIVPLSEVVSFGINPIVNIPNSVSIDWFVDNELIGEDRESIELETSMYSLGEHEVKVVLEDSTDLVRNDPSNLLQFELIWNLIIECNTNPDLNVDSDINIQDIIILVSHILETSSDIACIDLNGDQRLNVLDVIFMINIILSTYN